jgi:hypothetical protein
MGCRAQLRAAVRLSGCRTTLRHRLQPPPVRELTPIGQHLALEEALARLLDCYRAPIDSGHEHITRPITVGFSRSKHSGERAVHVKQVL